MVSPINDFEFSKNSEKQLATCHPDLVLIMVTALRWSVLDFGVSEGHRSDKRQADLFRRKKSKLDGVTKKSKHQSFPSMAADIYPYIRGASWDKHHCIYLAGCIMMVARILFNQGKITHKLRWGGDWDQDGEPYTDQTFQDLVHFELVRA